MSLIVMASLLCSKAARLLAGETPPRSDRAKRQFEMERLECRLALDGQIGTVMHYDGYLSAGVYDSGGHLVRTLFAQSPQEAGSVPLVWDGRDEYGLNACHAASVNLSSYTLTSDFQVHIGSLMSAVDDFFHIDDLRIVL